MDPKSYIRSLVGSGSFVVNGEPVHYDSMRILACQAKAGYSFYIQLQAKTKKGKKTSTLTVARGASTHYPDLASATTAVDAAVVAAQANGFIVKPTAGRGFVKAADSFSLDSLPKPTAPVAAAPVTPIKSKK